MLNKELLMAGSASLDPVLSISLSSKIDFTTALYVTLTSGEALRVHKAGETIFKFSELDLNARIVVSYYVIGKISTSNLSLVDVESSRMPTETTEYYLISDRTQSARISLE